MSTEDYTAQKEDVLRLSPSGLGGVLEGAAETERGTEGTSAATETPPNGKPLSAWEQRGKDSGKPPWGWLFLGIMALSLVYWLWGGGQG